MTLFTDTDLRAMIQPVSTVITANSGLANEYCFFASFDQPSDDFDIDGGNTSSQFKNNKNLAVLTCITSDIITIKNNDSLNINGVNWRVSNIDQDADITMTKIEIKRI